jgi:diguanylate cyclase (GGDEF)-like protein|tara:strand:- start:81 stop:1529 length:1449 start_codon:yes stop_codon:yes gene_type:complete
MGLQFIYFVSFLSCVTLLLFFFHDLRIKNFRGPFVSLIVFLWFFSYLTGQLGLSLNLALSADFIIKIRYSSSFYTLIFVGILLVYITEGTRAARNLILVSIGAQFMIVVMQIFVHHLAYPLLPTEYHSAALAIFNPSYFRIFISIISAIAVLFFAVFFYQFLVNSIKFLPNGILLFLSLLVSMFLDSFIFVSGTRWTTFTSTFTSHIFFKTLIVSFITVPLSFYINRFQKKGHLSLNRGSLDIFRMIETLEEDLEQANKELREYAGNLEKNVKERTQHLKSANIKLEQEIKLRETTEDKLKEAITKLEHVANTDALTGLYNRKYLEEVTDIITAQSKRTGQNYGVLMLDIDHFKLVNDTYGHDIGDDVIRILSQTLKGKTRNSDICIRYGGEEFVILLYNCDMNYISQIAQNIRHGFMDKKIETGNKIIQKTISVGTAIFPTNHEDLLKCIKYADLALYEAKDSGRNKVVPYSESLLKNKSS